MNRDRWCSIVWVSPDAPPVRSGWAAPETGRPVLPGLSVVTSTLSGGLCRVAAAGELNLMTMPLLDGAMAGTGPARAGSGGVLLDLSGVTFLDVAGLDSLRRADRLLQRRGLDLVVSPPVATGPGRLVLAAVRLGWLRSVFATGPGADDR